jgi:hypothetical protein
VFHPMLANRRACAQPLLAIFSREKPLTALDANAT